MKTRTALIGIIVCLASNSWSFESEDTHADSLIVDSLGKNYSSANKVLSQLTESTYTIDTELPVGTINGKAEVSLSGAATYQAVVDLPHSGSGFDPSVAVVYNSQAGNGLMGFGWNLSAVSVISRCGKSMYYDSQVDGVKLNATDNLMLDGQRLLLKSGYQLQNGSTYCLESDPTVLITYQDNQFVVKTKDGVTKSYISLVGSTPYLWLLTTSSDTYNNRIQYSYTINNNNHEYYLQTISYGSGCQVAFNYENRTDISTLYDAGQTFRMSKRLASIVTYKNNSTIKRYVFSYTYDGNISKLTDITQFAGDTNNHYNPTHIEYTGSSEALELISQYSSPRSEMNSIYADFNGDGKIDILSYPITPVSSSKAFLYLSEVSAYGNVFFNLSDSIALTSNYENLYVADVNGDGRCDLARVTKNTPSSYTYTFYECTNGELSYLSSFSASGPEAFVGDYNGDGKHELLIKASKQLYSGTGVLLGSGGIEDWGTEYIETYYPNNNYLFDFNGNGKTDLLILNGSCARIFEFNGTTFQKIFTTYLFNNNSSIYPGDFNGDGKTDILGVLLANNNPTLYYSTGTGFNSSNISVNITSRVHVGDFNRDGRSDILCLQIIGNQLRMNVGIYNGAGFTVSQKTSGYITGTATNPYTFNSSPFCVADFDGDGKSDFSCAIYRNYTVINKFTDSQNLLASSVINGIGARTTFSYTTLSDDLICSKDNNVDLSFPVVRQNSSQPIVMWKSESAGTNNQLEYYYYKNPIKHVQGKGFLGFSETTRLDANKQIKTISYYNYHPTYFAPYLFRQTEETADVQAISETNYYYTFEEKTPSKCYFAYVSDQTTDDYLRNFSFTKTVIGIDDYGNVLEEDITKDDITETVLYDYYNSSNSSQWVIGQPLRIEKQTNMNGSSWTKVNTYSYNSNRKVSQEKSFVGDGTKLVSTTNYQYNNCGQLVRKTSLPYSSTESLVVEYQYDENDQLINICDERGNNTSYEYDNRGFATESYDDFGYTLFDYDEMDRQVQIQRPDNTFVQKELSWDSSVSNSVYCQTTTETGKPMTQTYYDAWGRELRTATMRFDGTMLKVDRRYNNKGQLWKVSTPYKGNTPSGWTVYEYDQYGRKTREQLPSGQTNEYSYSQNSTTSIVEGVERTQTVDATGRLIMVSDNAGNIVYNLRADGQPISVVAPGNVTTTFTYDEYGRRKTINDPSAGLRTWFYDSRGNISLQRDQNNRTTIMTYNEYGDMLSKTTPEMTTVYTYNYYGQPLSAVSTNGTSREYDYDGFGRTEYIKETAPDNNWLQRTFSYQDGQLTSTTYQTKMGVAGTETYTYTNGCLKAISFNDTDLWSLNEENEMGRATRISQGKPIVYKSYGPWGQLTGIKTKCRVLPHFLTSSLQPAASTLLPPIIHELSVTLSNYGYTFDNATGNLLSRTDSLRNLTEQFGYDSMNRLTQYGANTMTYDVKGNILTKSDVGQSFGYNISGRPYAISSVEQAYTESIPATPQTITYNSFQCPATIVEGSASASFTYNDAGQRRHMHLSLGHLLDEEIVMDRYYVGDCMEWEEWGDSTACRLYLGGDAYSAPAVYVYNGHGWSLYRIFRDHLGSITMITSSRGDVEYRYSYDAWGRLRNPNTQEVYPVGEAPDLFLGRGYCGHEHLPWFGLINMNARLYDPAIGRFLNPDPYVQSPDFSQSFNRYSYCLNNPLKYTDKDGELPWLIPAIGALVGAYFGGVVANHNQFNPLKWNYSSPWTYLGIGGGALLGSWAGSAFATGGLTVKLAAVTPLGAVGYSMWTNQKGNQRGYIESTTVAGGHYTSYEKSVDKNVEQSYTSTIEKMQRYENWNSSAFNLNIRDLANGVKDNSTGTLHEFSQKVGRDAMYADYLSEIFTIYCLSQYNDNGHLMTYEIAMFVGGEIGAFYGGRLGGLISSAIGVSSGPEVVMIGALGYAFGSYIGYNIGAFMGYNLTKTYYLNKMIREKTSLDPMILMQYNLNNNY